MLPVSSNFTEAERADVNQVASKIYLVLGNYASASAFGATAAASGSDGSGNYPASGAIDGDRTEINVGAASAADNDVGLSSWRSAVAPSVTPQTLTIDFGQSRSINRIKLYHLASHGLSSYKLEYSADNATYFLIDKTTDQGGSIATTSQLDTIDFTEVTCRYVKLTVANTVVVADKANVTELECYRLVDITDRVTTAKANRSRDYKLTNPLTATFDLVLDNSDRFFSYSYSPTAAEIASGFVNSELKPNIGVIIQYGFSYGGQAPELVTVLNGFVDRIQVNPAERIAVIEGRDAMKVMINQIISSKLKTAQDISSCIQYTLNLCNISNWEMSLDSTGLTIDYFFINNRSALTVVRDLVLASADAAFYFTEAGIATFKYYVNATPQQHLESTQTDFQAGTVKTNVDTDSVPGQIMRKWFKIDDFADGNFNSNPAWTNRTQTASLTDDSQTNFEAGTVKTNLDTTSEPGSIKKKWFLVDDFADGDYTSNPVWTVWNTYKTDATGDTSFTAPTVWSVVSNELRETFPASDGGFYPETIWTPFSEVTGNWEFTYTVGSGDGADIDFGFLTNGNVQTYRLYHTTGSSSEKKFMRLANGYFLKIFPAGSTWPLVGTGLAIERDDAGVRTLVSGINNPSVIGTHTIRVLRDNNKNMKVFLDGVLQFTCFDSVFNTSTAIGFNCLPVNPAHIHIDSIHYSHDYQDSPGAYSGSQTVFESRVFDMSTDVTSLQRFTADVVIPVGSSLTYFTATSADGLSFDPYVAVANGGLITSTVRRYIKYKILFTCPIDSGTNNANVTTPVVNSVVITYTTIGWEAVSNAIRYQPKTNNVRAGIDIPFTNTFGTWRCNVTMTPGTLSGCKFRLYIKTSGWDIPTQTYLSGYYGEVDQAAGTLSIYKISATGSRSLLSTVAQAIDTSVHSLRVLLDSSGNLNLYWDEVLKVTTSDTAFSSTAQMSFEVDPNGDLNGNVVVDDIYFAGTQEGASAITDVQAVFESDVIDMSASISSLGIFQTGNVTPTGTSIAFYTATSADGVTFDAYISVTNGAAIPSTVRRYLKWKAVFTALEDIGTLGTTITPIVTDVTINWITGGGTPKYPSSVSYVLKDTDLILLLMQEISDTLGGDSSIINDVIVQAKPLILSGTSADVQWQGTTQTPPVPISVGAPLSVTNGQTLTYKCVVPGGMDTGSMSGASPAAAAITFAGGASGTWTFTRIHPTLPILQIVITNSGSITNLQLIGKAFTNDDTAQQQTSQNAASIRLNGDRLITIDNAFIVNSVIAASIASKLVANFKDPTSYIPGIQVRPLFSAQIGDRVTITEDNTKVNGDYVIAGLRHEFVSDLVAAQALTNLLLLKVAA